MVVLTSAPPMSFAAAAAAPPPTIVSSSSSSSNTTGSVLHTPFVFSYMRRGGGNKKAVTTTTTTAPTNPSVATNETAASDENATKTPDAATAATTTTKTSTGTTLPVQPTAIYETSIRVIRQIHTVEQFWETYDYIKRPNELNALSPPNIDYHFFRVLKNNTTGKYVPIKPTWEDPNNTNGGKWVIRLPKGLGSRYWEEIILALIGQQFTIHGNLKNESEEICGAVISIRYNEDILGIWNRNASPSNHVEIEKIRVAVQKILQLPTTAYMEYKPHETSLQDRTATGSGNNNHHHKSTTTGDASVGTTATTSTATTGSHHHHHHHHHHTTSAPSSRRSGSWTERDKTNTTNSNVVGTKHHHNKDTTSSATPRGSWRN